jgi:hypothetical protein
MRSLEGGAYDGVIVAKDGSGGRGLYVHNRLGISETPYFISSADQGLSRAPTLALGLCDR